MHRRPDVLLVHRHLVLVVIFVKIAAAVERIPALHARSAWAIIKPVPGLLLRLDVHLVQPAGQLLDVAVWIVLIHPIDLGARQLLLNHQLVSIGSRILTCPSTWHLLRAGCPISEGVRSCFLAVITLLVWLGEDLGVGWLMATVPAKLAPTGHELKLGSGIVGANLKPMGEILIGQQGEPIIGPSGCNNSNDNELAQARRQRARASSLEESDCMETDSRAVFCLRCALTKRVVLRGT